MRKYWSPAEKMRLRELWNSGMLATQIGKLMNRTPGSVAGYAIFMGLKSRRQLRRNLAEAPRQPKKTAPVYLEPATPISYCGTEIHDLSHGQCRYPFGDPQTTDFRWCANKSLPEKSYCAEHQHLCCQHVSAKSLERLAAA